MSTSHPWIPINQFGVTEEDMPPWAKGRARSYLQRGAQLCTKDGRIIGNAATVDQVWMFGNSSARIITDVGTEFVFTHSELKELFHPPEWLMDLESYAPLKGR